MLCCVVLCCVVLCCVVLCCVVLCCVVLYISSNKIHRCRSDIRILHLFPHNLLTCYWILDVFLQRPQVVKMNGIVSSTITLNTVAPQGCVLSPLLYSQFTIDCVSQHSSGKLVKIAISNKTHQVVIEFQTSFSLCSHTCCKHIVTFLIFILPQSNI